MKPKVVVTVLCFSLAIILAIAGIVILLLMDSIVHKEIASSIPLKKGSTSYDNWINPPVPVYMQFWLFHVTNGDAVQESGSRPKLEQKGPYTYQEHRIKKDITFNPNGTVSYREAKSYSFIRSMSAGDPTDVICNVNILLVAVAQKLQYSSFLPREAVSVAFEVLDGKHLFVNHTVEEWLWGYEDNLVHDVKAVLKALNISIALPFPSKVGLYYNKNGTDDGLYTVYTGTKGVSNFSIIDLWNGRPSLSFWNTKIANDINGTDGTMFPPFVTKDQKLYIFSSDICRSINAVYQKPVTLKGIDLMRFSPPASLFANVSVNPDNLGFCTPNCLGSGVLNVSVCQGGIPAIMSQPHFFQAAQKYIDAVEGLHPSPELSQTILDVDPHTGVVLNAAKKLQVNIAVRPVKDFDMLRNVDVFLPVVWVNESASVDDAAAAKFKKEVLDLINVANAIKIAAPIVGLSFLLIMIVVMVIVLRRSRREGTEEDAKIVNDDGNEQLQPE